MLIYTPELFSAFFGRKSAVSSNETLKLIKIRNIVAILTLLARTRNSPVLKECHFQNF